MSFRSLFPIGVCAILLASMAQGQDTQHVSAQGMVVDSLKVPLAQAQVLVVDSTNTLVADTSQFTFGPPRTGLSAVQIKAKDSRKFTLGIGGFGLGILKDGGLQLFRNNNRHRIGGKDTVDSAYPLRLFINGTERGPAPGVKNMLSQIPLDDIAEMHYIDCWDAVTPQFRNSLMVNLKPGKTY